ncbi:MAG: prepilin-type N-terminal cleavage/methylation domain-containing protein [Pseudomonadota bacterium]
MLTKLRRSMKGEKGFTLIELMIVVAIIGILAAIAIPNFLSYQRKAMQAEAKTNLGAIRTLEEAYAADHDNYATSIDALGFSMKGTARYTYGVSTADADSFTAIAAGNALERIAGDKWSIDEAGAVTDMDPASFTN